MKLKTLLATCLTSGALAITSAYADHMSPMGEGWANMPNDVHNTRLDPTVSDEEFTELVQGGDLADEPNRYDDDTSTELPPSSMTSTRSETGSSTAATMSRSSSRAVTRSSAGAMPRSGRR
jgi:hypothetical protein